MLNHPYMYIRIDPAKSSGSDFFIMDSDDSLSSLKSRNSLDCTSGGHQSLSSPSLVTTQTITCNESGQSLYTIIYNA